jgi:hypothetical protein
MCFRNSIVSPAKFYNRKWILLYMHPRIEFALVCTHFGNIYHLVVSLPSVSRRHGIYLVFVYFLVPHQISPWIAEKQYSFVYFCCSTNLSPWNLFKNPFVVRGPCNQVCLEKFLQNDFFSVEQNNNCTFKFEAKCFSCFCHRWNLVL